MFHEGHIPVVWGAGGEWPGKADVERSSLPCDSRQLLSEQVTSVAEGANGKGEASREQEGHMANLGQADK